MADEATQINFAINLTGGDDAAAAVAALDDALGRMGVEATRASGKVRASGRAQQEAKAKAEGLQRALTSQIAGWGALGGGIGQVGAVLGRINPELGRMSATVGQAGQSVTALATAIASRDPGALANALVSVTATVIDAVDAWQQYQERARQTAAVLRQVAAAAKTADDNIRGLAIRQARQRLQEGTATGEEVGGEIGRQRERVQRLEAAVLSERARVERLSAFEGIGGGGSRIGARSVDRSALQTAERILAEARSQVDQLEVVQNLTEARESLSESGPPSTSRRGGGGRRERRMSEEEALQQAILQEAIRRVAEEQELEARNAQQLQDIRRQLADFSVQLDNDYINSAIENRRRLAAKEAEVKNEMHEQAIRRLEESKSLQQAEFERVKGEAEGVIGPVISNLNNAIGEVIKGTKSADEAFQGLLSSFLSMIAERAALEAASNFAAAIGAAATRQYDSMGQHLAAGAAWTAVAAAAGVGAAAAAPSEATAAGVGQPTGGGEAQGGGTTVLNINGTVLTAGNQSGRQQLGRELGALVREGQRRFTRTTG